MRTEAELVAAAWALGARTVAGGSAEELIGEGNPDVAALRAAIAAGEDPLGDAFTALRSPAARRPMGATYTPRALVSRMLDGIEADPARIVDPGVGSGRFLVAAGRRFPRARLVGVELDPLAALLARAHLAAAGMAGRAEVHVGDFRHFELQGDGPHEPGKPRSNPGRRRGGADGVGVESRISGFGRQISGSEWGKTGPTLFVGNPPYVRHHAIADKDWLVRAAAGLGLPASRLSGLHVHFLAAIARIACPGDVGCLVTSAEWLDVNYGALARALLAGPLGLHELTLLPPDALPFPDAATTAVILRFVVGDRGPVTLNGRTTRVLPRSSLEAPRWSTLGAPRREGVELGELFRVHRGQVTGANDVWITDRTDLPSVSFPAVTRARQLFAAGPALTTLAGLRFVIDLPEDLEALGEKERAFLDEARRRGADQGWIARHRRPWWRVGLREPAPILATYMARRPPTFVRNLVGARHVNIAHGLYPRTPMAPEVLDRVAAWLRGGVSLSEGRVYAGGLTKFEPREMERIRLPVGLVE